MTPTAGLILAGGAGRRLGGADKPLLRIGDNTILARVLAALRAAPAEPIALSANGDPARFASFGLPVLGDGSFAGMGPLAGLLAGLDWAHAQGATALLTVPGDTPFLPPGLAAALAPAPGCAADPDTTSEPRTHHLVAIWPVAARVALRDWLARGAPRAVGAFAARIGMHPVTIPGAPTEAFLNVNTEVDLARARALADARNPRATSRRYT